MDIIKAYAVNNLCYITAKKMVPKGIVVHSTGANNPNLKRYVDAPKEVGENTYNNHWNVAKPGGQKVCVHAFIGYDKNKTIRIAEILPLDICCWGVGKGSKGSYNYDPAYIQFEICEDGLKDKSYYTAAFNKAAEYCAYLCNKYNLPIDNIVGHTEAYRKGYGSNHSDPEHWMKNFGENMDDFRTKVSKFLKSTESNNKTAKINSVASNKKVINKGDLVSIAKNATYYNGETIPDWVKNQKWYVKSKPSGDRVVIDKNESGTSSICSPINSKYLTVVKSVATNKTLESTKKVSYKVKITSSSLNIRKGAGTSTTKVGVIVDKGVYTIVEEKSGPGATLWGKLKSGVGWISLDYVKKL